MKTIIKSNQIQCNVCKDIIESKHEHDFKMCKCDSVGVDGGLNKYSMRRIGSNYTDLSEIIVIPETPMEAINFEVEELKTDE